jgi:hypothetical protein
VAAAVWFSSSCVVADRYKLVGQPVDYLTCADVVGADLVIGDADELSVGDAIAVCDDRIECILPAGSDRNGIRYLRDAISRGIKTPLTSRYVEEVLDLTGTSTLAAAEEAAPTLSIGDPGCL